MTAFFDPVATVEDAIVARVQQIFGKTLREVATTSGIFTAEEVTTRLRSAPGVYVAFLGGQSRGLTDAVIDSVFAVYILATNRAGEKARRRGDATAIGAYEIMLRLAPLLNRLSIANVGMLNLQSVANLYAAELNAQGLSLYALSYRIPISWAVTAEMLGNAPGGTGLGLGDFVTWSDQWDLPPITPPPDTLPVVDEEQRARDVVTLPGPYGEGPDGIQSVPIGATP